MIARLHQGNLGGSSPSLRQRDFDEVALGIDYAIDRLQGRIQDPVIIQEDAAILAVIGVKRQPQKSLFSVEIHLLPSSPISSAILPFSIRKTVVPVNRILRPEAAGNVQTGGSLKAEPV